MRECIVRIIEGNASKELVPRSRICNLVRFLRDCGRRFSSFSERMRVFNNNNFPTVSGIFSRELSCRSRCPVVYFGCYYYDYFLNFVFNIFNLSRYVYDELIRLFTIDNFSYNIIYQIFLRYIILLCHFHVRITYAIQ